MKLIIHVTPKMVLVGIPPYYDPKTKTSADFPPLPVYPGGSYEGISYARLRAAGDGEHVFPDPQSSSKA